MFQNKKFVGLHAHDCFSIFDGFGYPSEHIDYAVSNGMDALAVTNHGNMDSLSYQVLHAKKINSEGINFKPIYGVEAYFVPSLLDWREAYEKAKEEKKVKDSADDEKMSVEDEEQTKSAEKSFLKKRHHLVLLAMNETGLKNIFKLVSMSHQAENFYSYPRIDFEMLKKYNDGVICLQACLGGYLAKAIWENKDKDRETGESRIFATDNSGAFKYNVWLRNDGTVLIGDSDNPSAYTNNLIKWTEFNSVIQAYLTLQNTAITTAITGLGGTYVAPVAPNFTSSKTTKIKVN